MEIKECYLSELKVKVRGFEVVVSRHRKNPDKEIQLPVRGDMRSAGYDMYSPVTVTIEPNSKALIWTDVKAYMLPNEVLTLHVRSSIGIKKHLMLANITGIIDSSYYRNESNDGNIGVCLYNYGTEPVTIEEGERIVQAIFETYLMADDDVCLHNERIGGIGSSNR